MKTKTNEIPLSGPRGRKDLIEQVNKLEKKVKELEGEQIKEDVIEIVGNNGAITWGDDLPVEGVLNQLLLNGIRPTREDILNLKNSKLCVAKMGEVVLSRTMYQPINYVAVPGCLMIFGSVIYGSYGIEICISLSGQDDANNILYRHEV